MKIINYGIEDENGGPTIKPHHLNHSAVSIRFENWFDKEYKKLSKELVSNFVKLITKESGWSLHSIDFTDIKLSNLNRRGDIDGIHYQSGLQENRG